MVRILSRVILWPVAFIAALIILSVLLLLLSVPASWLESTPDHPVQTHTKLLLLKNANVIDVVEGNVIPAVDVLIQDGRILALGAINEDEIIDLTVVDLNGKYISPGLFDMHVHIHDRGYLASTLAVGVTSVRNMRGLPMHLRWKEELARGDWLGSTLYTSSPVLDGEKYGHALQQIVTTQEQARRLVRQYKDDGYDLIKAYGYLEPDVYLAIVDEAKQIGIPVAKHGPDWPAGLPVTAVSGLQSLEHVEEILQSGLSFSFDQNDLSEWLDEFETVTPVVTPTLATFHHLLQLSKYKQDFVDQQPLENLNPLYRTINSEFEVKRWLGQSVSEAEWSQRVFEKLSEIVLELHKRDIRLLVGSDSGTLYMPAGESTHIEMSLMVEAGLPELEVLRSATVYAAEAMGIGHEVGTVETGYMADLVITDDNPLEGLGTLSTPVAVVKGGQWLGEPELEALMKNAGEPSNLYVSLGRLLEDIVSRKFH